MTCLPATYSEYRTPTQAQAPGLQGLAASLTRLGQQQTRTLSGGQQDSLAAFNELVLEHQDAAYNFACYLLGDPDAAEDATQKAFLNAYLHIQSFQGTSFRSWLLKIVRNTCFDELRRSKRHSAASIEAMEDEETYSPELSRLSIKEPTPEQAFEQHEQARLIEAALARLDENFRTVVVLIDIQGMDYEEAAQVTGAPVGTVKSRLARARRQFREAYQALLG